MEWVWDIFGPYPEAAQTDPAGAPMGSYRVARGGSWHDPNPLFWLDRYFRRSQEGHVRSATRNKRVEWNRHAYVGFRLVRPMD